MSIFISGGGGAGGGATTLNGLGDVTITSAANGQILQYNSVSGVWENTGLNITGGLTYKGTFNATAGTPSLANAEQGDFYLIDTAGTYEGVVWGVGDHLLINADMGGVVTASKIDKIDNTDAVASVNGQTGVVVLDSDDIAEGAANQYFTDARADARADVRIAAADLTDLNDVSYTAGPGIDNYVLTYDNTAGTWGAEAAGAAPVDSVNGQTGVVVLDSDDVAEGAANQYFTDARADARIAAADLNDLNDVSYTAGPGIDNYVLTYDNTAGTWGAEVIASAPVASVNGQTGVVVLDSDDVAEGSANEYFTNARADARADVRIAAANLTALNDVSYTAGPGIDNYVLTYDNTAGTWGAEPAAAAAPVDSVNGQTGVVVLDSDDIAEGAANQYFTDARADARIAAANLTALNDVSYTAGPGIDNYVLTYDNTSGTWGAEAATTAPVDSVNGQTGVVVLDTDDVAEGAANEYFTDAKADARADVRIAAANLNALNDVSYTAGPAIDNYVLTYDNTSGTWGAEAAGGGGGGSRPTVTTDSTGANATISNPAAATLEDIYLVDNGATAVTITLPTVTGNAGYKAQIKRLGTANVTISPASGTIDGAATQVLSVQYAAYTLTTDGTNWFII